MTRSLRNLTTFLWLGAACAMGCGGSGSQPSKLPSDEQLIALFEAHRSELDSLRDNSQTQFRRGQSVSLDLLEQQHRIVRRLGFGGPSALEDTNRIFLQVRAQRRGDIVDSKGFAWLGPTPRLSVELDTLAHLDSLDRKALSTQGRHIRRLEGGWWLYRWIGQWAGD